MNSSPKGCPLAARGRPRAAEQERGGLEGGLEGRRVDDLSELGDIIMAARATIVDDTPVLGSLLEAWRESMQHCYTPAKALYNGT